MSGIPEYRPHSKQMFIDDQTKWHIAQRKATETALAKAKREQAKQQKKEQKERDKRTGINGLGPIHQHYSALLVNYYNQNGISKYDLINAALYNQCVMLGLKIGEYEIPGVTDYIRGQQAPLP